jgi:hypothetical protein
MNESPLCPAPSRRARRNPVVIALYLNAALLAAIVFVLATRGGSVGSSALGPSAAFGQYQAPIAGGAGLFVMPAQFSINTWGCYLLDVDRETLCAYEFYPGDKELRLIAARNFIFDRQLQDFNTVPSPLDVQRLVNEEKSSGRVIGSHPAESSPETPPKE